MIFFSLVAILNVLICIFLFYILRKKSFYFQKTILFCLLLTHITVFIKNNNFLLFGLYVYLLTALLTLLYGLFYKNLNWSDRLYAILTGVLILANDIFKICHWEGYDLIHFALYLQIVIF